LSHWWRGTWDGWGLWCYGLERFMWGPRAVHGTGPLPNQKAMALHGGLSAGAAGFGSRCSLLDRKKKYSARPHGIHQRPQAIRPVFKAGRLQVFDTGQQPPGPIRPMPFQLSRKTKKNKLGEPSEFPPRWGGPAGFLQDIRPRRCIWPKWQLGNFGRRPFIAGSQPGLWEGLSFICPSDPREPPGREFLPGPERCGKHDGKARAGKKKKTTRSGTSQTGPPGEYIRG